MDHINPNSQNARMGGQNSRWPSVIALMIAMVFTTFCIPLHLGVGWTQNRSITFESMLQDSVTSFLLILHLCSSCSLPLKENSCLCLCCSIQRPVATPANYQEGTATSVQQPLRKQNVTAGSFPSQLTWMQPWAEYPELEDPAKPHCAWANETARW